MAYLTWDKILNDIFDCQIRLDGLEEDRPRWKAIEERLLRLERVLLPHSGESKGKVKAS